MEKKMSHRRRPANSHWSLTRKKSFGALQAANGNPKTTTHVGRKFYLTKGTREIWVPKSKQQTTNGHRRRIGLKKTRRLQLIGGSRINSSKGKREEHQQQKTKAKLDKLNHQHPAMKISSGGINKEEIGQKSSGATNGGTEDAGANQEKLLTGKAVRGQPAQKRKMKKPVEKNAEVKEQQDSGLGDMDDSEVTTNKHHQTDNSASAGSFFPPPDPPPKPMFHPAYSFLCWPRTAEPMEYPAWGMPPLAQPKFTGPRGTALSQHPINGYETYCIVPKRLTLVSNLKEYRVSIAEIQPHAIIVFIGSEGTVYTDPRHNFFCQIGGRKFVRLISPKQKDCLYLISQVDLERPDFAKFSLFANTQCHEFVVEEGECLFIPRGWSHHVRGLPQHSFESSFQFDYHIGTINLPADLIKQWFTGSHELYGEMVQTKGIESKWFLAIGSYWLFIRGRLIIDLNSGFNSGLAQIYLTEISPANLHGAIGYLAQLFVTISILFSQILGLLFLLGTAQRWPLIFGFTIVFSSNARGNASSIAVLTKWLCVVLVGTFFLILDGMLHKYSFFVFTVLLALFIVFALKFLPETDNKTLEEVQEEDEPQKGRQSQASGTQLTVHGCV